jgi:NADH:ubiquinone oxidoreductase subunit F (NADH-binding)
MSLPRLLLGVGADTMDYATHRRIHGELPAAGRRARNGPPPPLVSELTRAALRGRGGGGFPLAAKLDAVGRSRGTPVVLVNGAEGEPMSVKDRMLLEALPHLVLDGAYGLADTLGTKDVVIALDETLRDAAGVIRHALAERPEARHRGGQPRIVVVPAGYVTGHETAIVNFINRGIARPVTQPPRMSERGIGRRPTLVSNAETLAQVALIARHGAEWFREIGPSDEPGSALVTLSGAVSAQGVYEIAHGSDLASLLRAAGGVTEPARAFLLGGYGGTWIDAEAGTALSLSRGSLRALGASLGAGVIVVLPASACPVAEVTRVAAWMADESASQCGPCINGLASIADALADVAEGRGGRDAFSDILRWSQLVTGRGACAHPDGMAAFVTSGLRVFRTEFEDHARHGPCDACGRRSVLITPRERSVVA